MTVGAVDRLHDVASTVQGPLSVRKAQFDALVARLLDEPALTSVGESAPLSDWLAEDVAVAVS